MDLPLVLAQPREAVQAEMRAVVGDRSLPIYAMVRYALGWIEADGGPRTEPAGKGIRPALAVLAGRAVDPSDAAGRRALAGAAAVEFVHNFSLVHDDIQDRDDERHHRPTVWRVWGEAQAINVGDALRELAQAALSRAVHAGADAGTVLAAGDTLNRCTLEMIEGQYLDLDYEGRRAVSAEDYLTMVERKTGALLGCSLALGALLAGGDRDVAARLEHAGRCLGLAFQIRDDALGIWGDSSATGKSSDSDIRRRKKSFPIVYALDATAAPSPGAGEGAADARATLASVYVPDAPGDPAPVGDADVRDVIRALDTLGARAAAERAAGVHYDGFLAALADCGLREPGRAALEEAGRFIVRREH